MKSSRTDYETNSTCILAGQTFRGGEGTSGPRDYSTCTSASIDKNNNRIFLDSVSKLKLIFWANLGKTTPTPLNGPAVYFITSSTTYLNMVL